jgi:cobalt-zinc-cadmium efflux system outer membrane protein
LAAFRAGELSLVELLLVNRQVLDGRRDLLDAGAEQRLTRVAIEEAAGWDRHPPRRQ